MQSENKNLEQQWLIDILKILQGIPLQMVKQNTVRS